MNIETLVQPDQHRFRESPDVERLRPIHGNLEKRANDALKYLVDVSDQLLFTLNKKKKTTLRFDLHRHCEATPYTVERNPSILNKTVQPTLAAHKPPK